MGMDRDVCGGLVCFPTAEKWIMEHIARLHAEGCSLRSCLGREICPRQEHLILCPGQTLHLTRHGPDASRTGGFADVLLTSLPLGAVFWDRSI